MKKTPAPTLYRIETKDRWKIALYRYPQKTKDRSPVFLVHGLASNRHNFDFPEKEKSLAQYLWRKGWDTWIIELRGAGQSTKPKPWEWFLKGWNYDHYILQDLPAAVDFVLKKSKAPRLHWIGHSMGGTMAFSFIKTRSESAFKSLVTVGSPLNTDIEAGYFKWTSKMDPLFKIFPLMPYRTMAKLIEIYADWIYRSENAILYVKENMDLTTLKLGTQVAVDDVSAGVLCQIHQWLKNKHFKSCDGKINYSVDFRKFKVPILLLTGTQDPFTPEDKVRKIFNKILTKNKKWIHLGRKKGNATDYGHLDLIIGKNAPHEVFPLISDWLEKHED